jgi:hypothetical protein
MSYTTTIRACLNENLAAIPVEVLAHLNAIDQVCGATQELILSADNEGCCDDLTVISASNVEVISSLLSGISNTKTPLLCLSLSVRDEDGLVVDTATGEVSLEHLNAIVDTAADLVLAYRKGQSIDDAVERLDSDLCNARLIDEQSPIRVLDAPVLVVLEINTDDGIADAQFESAESADTGKSVLIDTEQLLNAVAVKMSYSFPDSGKYGVPAAATRRGAEAFIKTLGLQYAELDLDATDSGDDSGEVITLTVQLPATAVTETNLDDVREFASLHWDKHFDSLDSDDQVALVNRYVQAINGVSA